MLNDLNGNGCSKLALPMGNIRVSRFWYVIMIVLVALILMVGGFNLYLRNLDGSSVGRLSKKNSPAKTTNLTVAKKVIDWLDTQRDESGAYWANYVCDRDPNFVCKEKNVSNYTGIPVMWGMSKYYLATKDEKVLNIIKKDLSIYADDKKVTTVGTYNLTCKLIDDMMSDPIWTVEEKQQLKKICLKTDMIADRLTGVLTNKTDLTQEKLSKNIYSKLDYLVSKQTTKKTFADYTKIFASQSNLDYYPFMSTEYLEKYKFTYDKSYLRKALFITDVLLEDYVNNKQLLADEQCGIGRNLLSFNDFDKNPHFSAVAIKIFEENKNINSFNCLFLGSELFKSTKSENYQIFVKDKLANVSVFRFLQDADFRTFIFNESKSSVKIELDKNALLVGLLSSEI